MHRNYILIPTLPLICYNQLYDMPCFFTTYLNGQISHEHPCNCLYTSLQASTATYIKLAGYLYRQLYSQFRDGKTQLYHAPVSGNERKMHKNDRNHQHSASQKKKGLCFFGNRVAYQIGKLPKVYVCVLKVRLSKQDYKRYYLIINR